MPLNTNWKAIADYYACSRSGDDANSGLDGANPKQSFDSVVALYTGSSFVTVLIRDGYYPSGTHQSEIGVHNIEADGLAVIDGANFNPFISFGNQNGGKHFSGVTFINVTGMTFNGTTDIRSLHYDNCVFYDCLNIQAFCRSTEYLNSKNLFISTFITFKSFQSGLDQKEVYRCTFVSSSIYSGNEREDSQDYLNCAFDEGSSFLYDIPNVLKINRFLNCAFESTPANGFRIEGVRLNDVTLNNDPNPLDVQYSDGEKFSGTYTSSTGHIYEFQNCFWSSNFLFSSTTKSIYTLQHSPIRSPLFNNNNFIGAYGLALFLDADDSSFDPVNGATLTNITNVNGDFVLDVGFNEGTVTSTEDLAHCITLPNLSTIEDFVNFSLEGFNFFNGEWVDRENYDPISNQEVRLTYLVKVYDEDGLSWGNFIEFELNQPLDIDDQGRGNGNVDFDFDNSSPIVGRRFAVQFVVRDNGV